MKHDDPTRTWLRIAAEARPHLPAPPPGEPPPAWFVTQALARRRADRARSAGVAPWFVLPGLARAATACTVLAVACLVFVLSTTSPEATSDPLFPELEFEDFDLP